MKIFLFISFFVSSILFANEELKRIQDALRAEIARLEQASNITIADVDALAEQFIDYLIRITPTDAQLTNFRNRLVQVLERIPAARRQGRAIEFYEGQYVARLRTVSMARASVSMQRAQSVAAPVDDRSALAQLERENMQHLKSRAVSPSNVIAARRIILDVLNGNIGVASEANRLTAGQTYLAYSLEEIQSSMAPDAQEPDAAREFQARILALESFARRLNLADLLNAIRRQRVEILSSVGYQRLLGNAQQTLNRAIADRSVSRVPGASNVRATFHHHSSATSLASHAAASRAGAQERSDSEEGAGRRRSRDETDDSSVSGRTTDDHESAVRAALSTVPGTIVGGLTQQPGIANLQNGTQVNVRVVDNAGGGDCLFYALGTNRTNFVQAIANNRLTNQNLGRAFADGIANNHPDYARWFRQMNAVQNRRLGTEYEVGLWHALTGIPVRVFRQQANGTWHEQAFYHQYTVDQQAERWIGYIGDGQNGHWVELQNGATLNGGIQLRMSSNDGNSTGGAGSGASGTSGFFGGIFGSLWPASR